MSMKAQSEFDKRSVSSKREETIIDSGKNIRRSGSLSKEMDEPSDMILASSKLAPSFNPYKLNERGSTFYGGHFKPVNYS